MRYATAIRVATSQTGEVMLEFHHDDGPPTQVMFPASDIPQLVAILQEAEGKARQRGN